MPKIKIEGNRKLTGTITVSGAKNSVVALIPAAILCDESTIISNVPNITDVDDLENILVHLNAKFKKTYAEYISAQVYIFHISHLTL